MNISDSSDEEDSDDDDSDKDAVRGEATEAALAGEKELEASKDLERLEKLAVQREDLTEAEGEPNEVEVRDLESLKALERLETGMLEKLAMEISDSEKEEEEDMSDDNRDEPVVAIVSSKHVKPTSKIMLAS